MNITVFTPTFNRAHLLLRCYESLLSQSAKNFEWLIIDDGSTDNTRQLVEGWISESKIKIQYIYQENGGKHKAHNTAVENCSTDFMLIFDSDDILSANCISLLEHHSKDIENETSVCGLVGNKFKISDGQVIGSKLPQNIDYASGNELYQKYNFEGDTLRLYKTAILKQFIFPVILGEKFMYENVIFDQIDSLYKMKLIYEELYYCDYLPDGYTANSIKVKLANPIGYSLSLNSSVRYSVTFEKAVNWTILYIIWCKQMNISQSFKRFSNKSMYVALYLPALLLSLMRQPAFFFKIIEQKKGR